MLCRGRRKSSTRWNGKHRQVHWQAPHTGGTNGCMDRLPMMMKALPQTASTDRCTAERRALEVTNRCIDWLPMTLKVPPRCAVSSQSGGAHIDTALDKLLDSLKNLKQ